VVLCRQGNHGEDLLWPKINVGKKEIKCKKLCKIVAQLLVMWGLDLQNIKSVEKHFCFSKNSIEEPQQKAMNRA